MHQPGVERTQNTLATSLTPTPDRLIAPLEHIFVEYTGWVLGELIKKAASQPVLQDVRSELLTFAKDCPERWKTFVLRSFQHLTDEQKNQLIHQLHDSMATGQAIPDLQSMPFQAFFSWNVPLSAALAQRLDRYLTDNLENTLQSLLVESDVEAKRAWKLIVNTGIATIHPKLDRIENNTVLSVDMLDSIEKKLDDSALSPLGKYKLALRNEFRFIEALHVPPPKDAKLRAAWNEGGPLLTEAFVPPPCSEQHYELPAFSDLMAAGEQPSQPFLPQLAKHRRIVLLADPGMGKSTLIRYLINGLAQANPPKDIPAVLKGCIPFPLILRDIISKLLAAEPDSAQWSWPLLLQVFKQWCPGKKGQALLSNCFATQEHQALLDEYFQSEHAFFLIDGLDEVGNESLRLAMQKVIFDGYNNSHKQARFLITSRVIGYSAVEVHHEYLLAASFDLSEPQTDIEPDHPETIHTSISITFGSHVNFTTAPGENDEISKASETLGKELQARVAQQIEKRDLPHSGRVFSGQQINHAHLLYLAPFTDNHQKKFALYWFGKRLGHENADAKTQDFLQAVRQHPSIYIISRCPYVLLLLTVVYHEDLRLPDGRAQVYARLADIYLEKIDDDAEIKPRLSLIARQPAAVKKQWLQIIAMHMQCRRTEMEDSHSESGTSAATKAYRATDEDLCRWLEPVIDSNGYENKAEAARAFAQYLGERTGLFLPREANVFEWMHNSFMEFFAARYVQEETRRVDALSLSRLSTERKGKVFDEYRHLTRYAPGPIPVTEAEMALWAADPRWHEVIIFLLENLGKGSESLGQTAQLEQVERHLESLFPPLYADLPQPLGEEKPLTPLAAVELAVKVAWDRDLRLPQELLNIWWEKLWTAWLLWPHNKRYSDPSKRWHLPPLLLAQPDGQKERLSLLVSAWKTLSARRIDLSQDDLDLSHCLTLTSDALAPLAELRQLKSLSLGHCTGLVNTLFLEGCEELEILSLICCTGLQGREAWNGLVGLRRLKQIWLYGCTGLSDTQALAGCGALEWIWLHRCTGLQNNSALNTLVSLRKLKGLWLDGCTGLVDIKAVARCKALVFLSLADCTGLQGSAALSGLMKLRKLRQLLLDRCIWLMDTDTLAGIETLEWLSLTGCTGLQGPNAFNGLVGLRNLTHLALNGCIGLLDTEALENCKALETLSLENCSGLEGRDALKGLISLPKLKQLWLAGCTGLSKEDAQWLEERIGRRCMIMGP